MQGEVEDQSEKEHDEAAKRTSYRQKNLQKVQHGLC